MLEKAELEILSWSLAENSQTANLESWATGDLFRIYCQE